VEDAEVEEMIELRSSAIRAFEELSESRRTAAGITISPETSLQCSAVLACVRVISESVASLPLNLYRRIATGGKMIAAGVPLHTILSDTPNGWMTGFEFRELMQSWLLLWGNAYAEIRPGQYGSVTELWPMHPSRMKVERLKNGRLRYLYTEPDSTKPTPYAQDQIFHIRWLTQDGVTGYVPTNLSKDAIALARATELHSGAYFGNGARPGIILETDQPLKPETAQRLRQTWEEMHRGPDRASKTAVLPHGVHAKELSVNNGHSQLLETRRYQVEEIARSFRVPAYMIGDLTKSSYSSVEQQGLDFVTFSLVPWLRRWEACIRRDLILDDETYFAEFDVRGLMRGDNAARAAYFKELWQLGVLSINEIRESEGLNPIESGDKRFVQVNMALLESFTVEPPPPEVPPPVASPAADEPPPGEEQPAMATDQVAREVVFSTTLRKLANLEAEGIIERRNKPQKLAAWLEAHERKMRIELREAAEATGRQIDDFVVSWMNKTRELLLDCHRSGLKYESVMENWCDEHQNADASTT
jgi:HK97 family phage portal protein